VAISGYTNHIAVRSGVLSPVPLRNEERPVRGYASSDVTRRLKASTKCRSLRHLPNRAAAPAFSEINSDCNDVETVPDVYHGIVQPIRAFSRSMSACGARGFQTQR
jgi:hypothetical protein